MRADQKCRGLRYNLETRIGSPKWHSASKTPTQPITPRRVVKDAGGRIPVTPRCLVAGRVGVVLSSLCAAVACSSTSDPGGGAGGLAGASLGGSTGTGAYAFCSLLEGCSHSGCQTDSDCDSDQRCVYPVTDGLLPKACAKASPAGRIARLALSTAGAMEAPFRSSAAGRAAPPRSEARVGVVVGTE